MEFFIKRDKIAEQVLILVVLSYFFLMMGNGVLSLTNPDEVFYAQTAREMMQQKSWMTPYLFGQPQFEKPVLTYWLLRLGFELFGTSSFAARFFPALWGMLGVLAVYFLGLLVFKDDRKAMGSALVMMSSSLYVGLSRTVFTDLFFSVFILFSLTSFYWAHLDVRKKGIGIYLSFVFSALAVLSKGPLGFLIPGAVIFLFLLLRKELKFLFCREIFLGFLLFVFIAVPWYVLMISRYGNAFSREFFTNDHIRRILEAEHAANDTWYFYPASIFGCMFPWSFYLCGAFVHLGKVLKRGFSNSYLFLACWIIAVLLIFQPAHSKLVSYIFPLFPALALLCGDFIVTAQDNKAGRALAGASLATSIFFLTIPAGLLFAAQRFSSYVVSRTPVILFAVFLGVYALVLFVLFLRRKFLAHLTLVSAILPLFFYFAFLVHTDFDAFISSQEPCDFLLKNYRVENTVLCSKFYARGVRYFTDKDVAVIDLNGEGFFSPHPIPYFKGSEEVRSFLRQQPLTYAILKKGNVEDIRRCAGDEFSPEVLKVFGDEYVVRIAKR